MYSIHSNNSCINNTPFSFILLEKGCVHNLFTHAFVVGYVVDGKYNSIHSGVLGGNQKRENDFSRGATIFYGLGGVCGVIFAGTFLGRRKR